MVKDGGGLAVGRTDVVVIEVIASAADDMDRFAGLWSNCQA